MEYDARTVAVRGAGPDANYRSFAHEEQARIAGMAVEAALKHRYPPE